MDPGNSELQIESAARAVLDRLESKDYEPVPQRELLHRMQVRRTDRPRVRRAIRRLVDAGRIVKLSRGRLAAAPKSDRVPGVLHRHPDGYGFVVPEDGGEDLFIAPPDLGAGLTGDRVEARIIRRGRMGRLQGTITKIVERSLRSVLGMYVPDGRDGRVLPFDPGAGGPIQVPETDRGGARVNDVVRVERLRAGEGTGGLTGEILEVLGSMNEPGIDTRVVCHTFGLETRFPDEVRSAESELPHRIGPAAKRDRTSFDDPAPVTIDGETARDFDDAIAVRELGGGITRLWVHIADVSHFVAPGTRIDREARHRGTSVYFPDRVLPMLPERLSNDLCSLRPGVDRLVQSAILDIDAQGELKRVRFADGVIRSAARLTYTQVAALLEGESGHRIPAKVVPMLEAADRLRTTLEARRARRGSIDFDLPVPRILLDVEGAMTGITIESRNKAHRLIEECMLIANEAVAEHLQEIGWPCMFRVHETPDPLKLETLSTFVRGLGYPFPERAEEIDRQRMSELLGLAEGRPDYVLIGQLAVRSMKQARYSMENIGHFGLAAPTYCHFTSPIRRYPDLVIHRLLRMSRDRARAPEGQTLRELEAVAQTSSELERNAESAERALLAWKKVAFIRDRVGESFSGIVTGVNRFGLFVQLEENLVEGLIRIERLGRGRIEFLERRQELRSEVGNQVWKLGDRLEVTVDRVDPVLRRVDLSPTDDRKPSSEVTDRHSKPRPAGETQRPRKRKTTGKGRRRR